MVDRYRPIVHHQLTLKPHHKKILIGGSSLVLILLIALSIFTYMIFVKQNADNNQINNRIDDLRAETQSNINALTESILTTNEDLKSLNSELGVINEEFGLLKSTVSEDFSGIIDIVIPSVVTVRTDSGQGTGFIINAKENSAYLVTNAHVLANSQGNLASGITAITYTQATKDAEFIGFDSTLDIALLKIQGGYNAINLGDSEKIQIGERVIAIGNPLGLQFSVSQGIVSAVHRQGINGLNAYIQTDTPLNPGNSGGPLLNKEGKVIGINNFKVSSGESLGFALESNYIKKAVNEISQEALNITLID